MLKPFDQRIDDPGLGEALCAQPASRTLAARRLNTVIAGMGIR